MNRRDSLKLMALGVGASAWPASAAVRQGPRAVIYDGRFAEARSFAHGADLAFDCAQDAAALWYRSLAGNVSGFGAILGLTSAADAMVLADCARREGLRLITTGQKAAGGPLLAWQIMPRKFA